jgi:hypothetical protein
MIGGFLALAITLSPSVSPASAKLLTWTCAYPKVSNANGVANDQALNFVFTVDDVTGKAMAVGSAGKRGVEIFAGQGGITFLERLPSGAVQITSIDASGTSVHSRHALAGGQLIPSQSYGRCAGSLNAG